MTKNTTSNEKFINNAAATTLQSSSDIHGCAPVFFPPPKDDKVDDDESQITFVDACKLAAESHRPLYLSQDITDLSETIVLRRRQLLSIVGRISSSTSFSSSCESSKDTHLSSSRRIQIAGKIHSLFLLNNQSRLKLQDLELAHQDDDEEDCRKVGAAVNLRYKSKAWLDNCYINSHAGFCCWAVQKASMNLDRCYLEAPLRSALVCFGQTRLEARSSTIANVGVHGVCARGECHIRLDNSSIVDSAVRGIYAYANASVYLNACTISGTMRPDMAAIEISSVVATPAILCVTGENDEGSGINSKTNKRSVAIQKTSSLTMNECHVIGNAGVGVRIRGGVRHNLSSKNDKQNYFAKNLGGNEVDFRSTSAKDLTNQKLNGKYADRSDEKRDEKQYINRFSQIAGSSTNYNNDIQINRSNEKLQRDPSGSSFRKGDWWCSGCVPKKILQGSKDYCPRCRFKKSDGKFLSAEEVIKLNRNGVLIERDSTTNIVLPSITNITANNTQIENAEEPNEAIVSPVEASPTWWFDGDDAGWLPYDTESNQKLESAFRSFRCLKKNAARAVEVEKMNQEMLKRAFGSKIVSLSAGRYSVNIETMEQINTDSHFLRLVQRREN